MLWVVAKEVALHVDHEEHRRHEVEGRGDNGVPETLRIRLIVTVRWFIFIHRDCDGHKL